MKSFEQLSEDLATRRAELKQRQREQGVKFKQKSAATAGAQKATSSEVQKRAADDSKASLDRIKQAAAAKAEAERARKAKQKEREDISKEIAASRDQKQDEIEDKKQDREEIRKSREKKRMAKEKKREELQKTLDTVG
jgi:hypothetical protein